MLKILQNMNDYLINHYEHLLIELNIGHAIFILQNEVSFVVDFESDFVYPAVEKVHFSELVKFTNQFNPFIHIARL